MDANCSVHCMIWVMLPHKYLPNYTVEDYNLWEGDWELIDGIPYAMSPSPQKNHQILAAKLVAQLDNSVEREKCADDCAVASELDWVLNNTTVLRPDVVIICDKKGSYISEPPALVIEILSPSSAFKDRQVKLEIYEEQGVKYYIVIDPILKTYNIYVLSNDRYIEQSGISSFNLHAGYKIQLDIIKALKALD